MSTSFVDSDGTTRFRGELVGFAAPGTLVVVDRRFTERTTAGVYTATIPILAGSYVEQLFLIPLAVPWAADTALLDAGDAQSGSTAYYGAVDVNSVLTDPWDSPALVGQGVYGAFASYALAGTGAGYDSPDQGVFQNANLSNPGVRYAADDTLTITLTTTIVAPPVVPTGDLIARCIYFAPVTATPAVFV